MTLSSDDLAFMPATAMAAAIRSRKLSPIEVTRAILERIERLNPRLNAYLTVDGEGAMQAARRAEQAVVDGDELGPLHGVPVSVKDLVCTRGLRTTFGSLLHREYVPDHDAGAVERLRAAGAIILGKTNTPEFGLMGSTENRLGEPCRNPWNRERTSGGSSGGAGSAVAAGLGPLALGTDGGARSASRPGSAASSASSPPSAACPTTAISGVGVPCPLPAPSRARSPTPPSCST